MPLGMEVGLGSGDFVFDGDPVASRKKGTLTHTQFLAHVLPIVAKRLHLKVPLGTEVGVGLSDTVLDGDPAPLPYRGTVPQFSATVRCG